MNRELTVNKLTAIVSEILSELANGKVSETTHRKLASLANWNACPLLPDEAEEVSLACAGRFSEIMKNMIERMSS